jgi:hypothetical protein
MWLAPPDYGRRWWQSACGCLPATGNVLQVSEVIFEWLCCHRVSKCFKSEAPKLFPHAIHVLVFNLNPVTNAAAHMRGQREQGPSGFRHFGCRGGTSRTHQAHCHQGFNIFALHLWPGILHFYADARRRHREGFVVTWLARSDRDTSTLPRRYGENTGKSMKSWNTVDKPLNLRYHMDPYGTLESINSFGQT